jgi:hypothetical protein
MERNIVIDELVSSVNDILYELDIIQISVKDFGIFPYMISLTPLGVRNFSCR